MDKKTIIACAKVSLDVITYQEVITMVNDDLFLSNVNIMLGSKIIKKIRFQPGEKDFEKGIGKEIAIQYLKEKLYPKRNKRSRQAEIYNEPKIQAEAVNNAAKNLFTELGL